jgi:hypothetical protein
MASNLTIDSDKRKTMYYISKERDKQNEKENRIHLKEV